MIAIVNIGGDDLGICEYSLRINAEEICKFEHDRRDGLVVCLKKASEAAERARWEKVKSILEVET